MTEIITRKEATARGLKRYFTGKPCARGHLADRAVTGRQCYECVVTCEKRKAQQAEYRTRPEIKVRKKEVLQAYWKRRRPTLTEDERAKFRAATQKWRMANIDKARELDRQYAERRKEKRHAYAAAHAKKYPELYAAKARNRRARIRKNGGIHTIEDVKDILKLQKGKCAYCKLKLSKKYHVDHIIPLAMNGANDRTNLQILCKSCNHRKWAKHPIDFAQELGMLL